MPSAVRRACTHSAAASSLDRESTLSGCRPVASNGESPTSTVMTCVYQANHPQLVGHGKVSVVTRPHRGRQCHQPPTCGDFQAHPARTPRTTAFTTAGSPSGRHQRTPPAKWRISSPSPKSVAPRTSHGRAHARIALDRIVYETVARRRPVGLDSTSRSTTLSMGRNLPARFGERRAGRDSRPLPIIRGVSPSQPSTSSDRCSADRHRKK